MWGAFSSFIGVPPMRGSTLVATARSERSSTNCGYSARNRITATTGTITAPSATLISRDSAPGASGLCIERWYSRIM